MYYEEEFVSRPEYSRNPPQPGALTPLGSTTSRSEEALAAVQLAEDDFNRHLREAWAGWTLDVRVEGHRRGSGDRPPKGHGTSRGRHRRGNRTAL